jgi:hypothetical protein
MHGFYKYHPETATLVRAGKFVYGPTFTLLVEEKDIYDLPVDGWYWFDTKEEALAFFNLSEDVEYVE